MTGASTRSGRVRDGKFHIDDLEAGEYQITVHQQDENDNELLPPRYSDPNQSALKIDVTEGRNECDLELTVK